MQQDFQEVSGAVLVGGGQGKVLQPECAISQQALNTKGYLKSCHQVFVSTFSNGYHGHSSLLTCSHLYDKHGVQLRNKYLLIVNASKSLHHICILGQDMHPGTVEWHSQL